MEGAAGGGAHYHPLTVEELFRDFKARRAAMIEALVTDAQEFYKQRDSVISGEALSGLNVLPEPLRKNKSSNSGYCDKSHTEHVTKNQEKQNKFSVETTNNEAKNVTSEIELGNSEVEYIESENLNDVEDVGLSIKMLLAGLESKEWLLVCEALNNVRRLSIFHKEAIRDILGNVISLIVKSLKNPRSAVCKTAIMTSNGIFTAFGDQTIDSIDPLLVQLLLKSSQDKRFVFEAAGKALVAMTTWVSPNLLLGKLQPHLKNKNPRIRAKASMCFCRSVPRLGVEGIKQYGLDRLTHIAATQLSDQLPESREAARTLLIELQTIFEKSHISVSTTASEDPQNVSWEHFIQSNLLPLSAQAVLRITNIAPRDIVVGS